MGYKFNAGSEKDDEIFIGAYTAEYWEYDSRLGRRWNVDPLTYAWQSSYATFNNNPIYFVDPLGLEGEPKQYKGKVATFFHRVWDGIRGRGWNHYYPKHTGVSSDDGGGSWLKKIIQPVANAIRNLFTGGKFNLNTVPVARWRTSGWLNLPATVDANGDLHYTVPSSLAANNLRGTRITTTGVQPGTLSLLTLAAEVNGKDVTMRSEFYFFTQFGFTGRTTYSGILSGLSAGAGPMAMFGILSGDVSMYLQAIGLDVLGRIPGRVNPVFKKADHFTISVRANQPFGVNFAVRHRVLRQITGASKLFKWYHGL